MNTALFLVSWTVPILWFPALRHFWGEWKRRHHPLSIVNAGAIAAGMHLGPGGWIIATHGYNQVQTALVQTSFNALVACTFLIGLRLAKGFPDARSATRLNAYLLLSRARTFVVHGDHPCSSCHDAIRQAMDHLREDMPAAEIAALEKMR